VRYALRPLNAVEELASFLPGSPRRVLQDLVHAYRGVLAGVRHRGELALLEGVSSVDGAPLRVTTDLGRDALAYWSELLFTAAPTRRAVGEVRGLLGFTRVAAPEADLTLLRLNGAVVGRARARGRLAVPVWAHAALDTRRSLDAIVEGERSGRSSRKNDVRRTEKAGFRPVLARGPAELRHFFEEWCHPFIQRRFGAGVILMNDDWMRQMARVCEVMWIERGGARVGAALLEPRGGELRNLAFGVRDPVLVREGVLSACYWFMIERAVREGYAALWLGGSRPVLSDGVLRHKLKWGGVLRPIRQWEYVALSVDPQNATARAILAAHPLVAEDRDGFVAVASGDTSAIHGSFGLARILAAGEAGWASRGAV
jgi:hypothetical protein